MARSDGSTHRVEETGRHPALTQSPAGRKIESVPPVRAEELLRTQLQAPRTKSLAPVLATLQPDQYELVTVPAMESMIVEGQPGTGKTIVASHRAAYLINEERPPENTLDGNILLIGPTIGYSNHVRDVVNRMTGGTDRIKILAIPQLMQRILGLKDEPRGRSSRSQSPTACATVYLAGNLSPASSSLWSALSLSRTSCLVLPVTFRRIRFPPGPWPREKAPTYRLRAASR